MRVVSVQLPALWLLAWLAAGIIPAAHANPIGASPLTGGQDYRSRTMRVYGPTDPPYAFWRFCEEHAGQCARRRAVEQRMEVTAAQIAELDALNRRVNAAIEPVTDSELYGVSDYWTLPRTARGDCEDYTLLKRKMLIDAGWPPSALLVTVVRDEKMEGHAVLTARTTQGDFILDNKTDEMKLWSRTNYRFVMRQSFIDPKSWVALDPAQSPAMSPIAGVELQQ